MFGSFGWMELLLILFIVLIIFGAGKLPQLGEGIGKAIKGFKRSVHEAESIAEDMPAQGGEPAPTLAEPGSAAVQTATSAMPQGESQSAPPVHPPGSSSGPV